MSFLYLILLFMVTGMLDCFPPYTNEFAREIENFTDNQILWMNVIRCMILSLFDRFYKLYSIME